MANPHRGVASVGLGRDPGSGNHGVLIKRHHREWDPSCKVFIGGLRDAPTRCRFDIEFHFSDVGKVKDVWVSERPPGFAYVEMESEKDAIKSVKQLNGMYLGGGRVTVEISRHIDDKKQDRERRLKKWDKVNDRVKQEQARGINNSLT